MVKAITKFGNILISIIFYELIILESRECSSNIQSAFFTLLLKPLFALNLFFGSVLIFGIIDQTWKDLQILRKEGLLLLRYYHDHKLCKLQGCFTPVYLWYHCHTLVPDRFPVSPPARFRSRSLLAVWSQLLHLPVALPGVELFPHVVAWLAPSLHSALCSNTTQMSALSLMQSSPNTQTRTAYFLTCVCFPQYSLPV